MPSSPRVKPPKPIWWRWSTPRRTPWRPPSSGSWTSRWRGSRPAGCAPSAGSPSWVAALAQGAGLGGLRPFSPDQPGPDEVVGPARRAQSRGPGPARARRRERRRGDRRVGPPHRAARGRHHAGRGAARPPAAGRRGPAARCGCRARSAWPCAAGTPPASGSTWCRRWRRPSAPRRWSSGPRPARRSRWSAASSCCSTTGARTRPASCAPAGWACASCKAAAVHLHVDEPTAALLVEVAAEARLLAARFDDDGNAVFAPTDEFDAWTRLADRRAVVALVARAWLGHQPPARAGRHARRRGQGPHRPLAREHQRLRRRDPPDAALDQVAALPGRRGAGVRHRARLARRAAVVAASPPAAHPRRPGGVGAARGDGAGPGRPRRGAGVRAGAAGGRRRRRRSSRRCCPSPSTTCCCRRT